MMAVVLGLCVLGALACVVGALLYLRVVRRLEHLAREVERRIVPYLNRRAAAVSLDAVPPAPLRSPEAIIDDTCQLSERLLAIERQAEDMALGPTQTIRPGAGSTSPTGPVPSSGSTAPVRTGGSTASHRGPGTTR